MLKKLIAWKKVRWKNIWDVKLNAIGQRGYQRWQTTTYTKFWRWIWYTRRTLIDNIVPATILAKYDHKCMLTSEKQTEYCSGIGMLLHLMHWVRSGLYNAVNELSHHMTIANKLYFKAVLTKMNYFVGTKNWGLFISLKEIGTEIRKH